MNELIIIGKTVSTHGIKGELKVISDFEYTDKAYVIGNKILINNYGGLMHPDTPSKIFSKIQKKYNKCRNRIFGLTLTGIISLIIYTSIYLYNDSNFALEIFGFISTFTLWEAIDAYIYNLSDIKVERENITQNLLMKVAFDNNYENEKSSSEEVV